MLPVLSDISPIIGGIIAPPTIDITRKAEAILLSSPRPLIPKAKIVGNIIDIKKGAASNAYTAVFPDMVTATVSNKILIIAYRHKSREGFMYLIKNVPAKRPTIKPTIAIMPHQ